MTISDIDKVRYSPGLSEGTAIYNYVQLASGRVLAGGPEAYYSDDLGVTWAELAAYNSVSSFDQAWLYLLSTGRILATHREMHNYPCIYSDDDGVSWAQGNTTAIRISGEDIVELDSGRLVGVGGNAWDSGSNVPIHAAYSDDGGITWQGSNQASAYRDYRCAVVTGTGRVIIAGEGDGSTCAVYSDDEGVSWSPVVALNDGYWADLLYIPLSGKILVLGRASSNDIVLLESDDDGDTWSQINSNFLVEAGMTSSHFSAVLTGAADDHLVITTGAEITESDDLGVTWTPRYTASNPYLKNTLYSSGDIDLTPTGGAAFLLQAGGWLLFTVTGNHDYMFRAESDLSPLSFGGGGGGGTPPDPWWTGYEGVTEVRRA